MALMALEDEETGPGTVGLCCRSPHYTELRKPWPAPGP
jgi:hypothetical protein